MTSSAWDPVILASYLTLAGDVVPESRPGGQISPFDISARIDAASAAGYRGMGFAFDDFEHWSQVHGAKRIRQWLDDSGIQTIELEMLHDWWETGEKKVASDAMAKRLLRWATELSARHLKVGTGFVGRVAGQEQLIDGFGALCAKASQVDLVIALEPMPFAMLGTPQAALDVIEAAGAPNAGLLLDIWHVYRAGVDYEALREIPAHRIITLEVLDGGSEPVRGDMILDSLDHRRLAGTGEFDVDGFLAAILATGYRGPIGDEMISIENRARSLPKAAGANYTAVHHAVERANAGLLASSADA